MASVTPRRSARELLDPSGNPLFFAAYTNATLWRSSRVTPSMRQPPSSITARLSSHPPSGPGWAHEIKRDGYRFQIHVRDGRLCLYTIKRHRLVETLPADCRGGSADQRHGNS